MLRRDRRERDTNITNILVSSNFQKPEPENSEDEIIDNIADDDYLSTMWSLSPLVQDVVKYIAEFIAEKINKKNVCTICTQQCIYKNFIKTPHLIRLKNRGGLVTPHTDVIIVCFEGERIFKEN